MTAPAAHILGPEEITWLRTYIQAMPAYHVKSAQARLKSVTLYIALEHAVHDASRSAALSEWIADQPICIRDLIESVASRDRRIAELRGLLESTAACAAEVRDTNTPEFMELLRERVAAAAKVVDTPEWKPLADPAPAVESGEATEVPQ